MFTLYALLIITALFSAWRAWRRLRYFLHMFQLEGYKTNEFAGWLGARLTRIVMTRSHVIGLITLALLTLGMYMWSPFWATVIALPVWTVTFASSRYYRSEQQKKPLAYTPRLKRLLGTAAVLAVAAFLVGLVYTLRLGLPEGVLPYLAGFWVADFGAPLWVMLAAYLMKPVERAIQNGFKRQAHAHLLSRPDLTVIAITGSYGKTSVKFILAEVLRQRFNVLATPASYNTPMGICIVVNNRLKPEHQMLVLEMGARYTGDIKELCELAPPDIGIVTSIGVAHLETMGPIENIARVKGELVRHMKPGGPVVLNADDPRVAALATDAKGKVWTVSVAGKNADLTAHDIRYDLEGATFTVKEPETGHTQVFKTKLLGRHNVLNILMALAVGRHLGLRLRQMAHAVQRLEPVAHRLQLRQAGALTVIDDAFNSNPVGARNAVEILGRFTTGRRILITPGMIELGEQQWDENHALGRYAANHIDLALLVGPRQTEPIQEGLKAGNFPEDRIHVFQTLFDAQNYLKAHAQAGDVVLYENDLPDQYDETT